MIRMPAVIKATFTCWKPSASAKNHSCSFLNFNDDKEDNNNDINDYDMLILHFILSDLHKYCSSCSFVSPDGITVGKPDNTVSFSNSSESPQRLFAPQRRLHFFFCEGSELFSDVSSSGNSTHSYSEISVICTNANKHRGIVSTLYSKLIYHYQLLLSSGWVCENCTGQNGMACKGVTGSGLWPSGIRKNQSRPVQWQRYLK